LGWDFGRDLGWVLGWDCDLWADNSPLVDISDASQLQLKMLFFSLHVVSFDRERTDAPGFLPTIRRVSLS
jgi:hypothetical protein